MITDIGHMVIFGLPIALYFGIAAFICLLITVTIGLLLVKTSYPISFAWHPRMVAVTIGFVLIHITLVTWQYFF
jgi:hypothetical protein